MKNKIIALCGLKYSGKDTTCRLIINELCVAEINSQRFAFADRLKQEVCVAYGIPLIELEANKSFWRPVLQFWGTEFRRLYQRDDNYWIARLRTDLLIYFQHFPNAIGIVTDCRYLNEIAFLREEFETKFLWIDRSRVTKHDKTGNTLHASENSVNAQNCDFTVDNNGELKQLEREIYNALRSLRII